MKKQILNFSSLMALIALMFTLSISSCKKDDAAAVIDPADVTAATEPVVPSTETMLMVDYSELFNVLKGNNYTYFSQASVVLNHWENQLFKNFKKAVPLFAEAQTKKAVLTGTNEWTWTLNKEVIGIITITGKALKDTAISWKISVNGITYVTGQVKRDKSAGYWILYKDGAESVKETWTYNASDKTGTALYTAMNGTYKDSYLKLSKTKDVDYNVYFIVSIQDNTIIPVVPKFLTIAWNSSAKNGKIKGLDGVDHFWNSDYSDKINVMQEVKN